MSGSAARSGRRPGVTGTRAEILDAARTAFARDGYAGTSLRAVARAAGVDQSLVHHFFGTKQALLLSAVELPFDPATALAPVLAGDPAGLGERLVRFYLRLLEDPATRTSVTALLQAAMTHEQAAGLLRTLVTERVVGRIVKAVDGPQPALRATLVGSQLVGLAVVRYVVRVEPLASATGEQVVSAVAPTLQRYLTGPLSGADA